jgi:surface carbohydrate biosynthesis protein (TIGR04326 family)
MSNTLLICKDPDHYRHGYDMVFYWESFDESYGAYSIPKIVEAKSESLRSSYLDWLYRFGRVELNGKRVIDHLLIRNDFSYWWMTLLIEKSQWKSKGLYKVFRLMALNTLLLQHNIKEIDIELDDKDIYKSINQYCINNKIKLNIPRISRPTFTTLFCIFHALIILFRYSIRTQLVDRKKINKQRKIGNITFFSYFFNLDNQSIKNFFFYTRYWASLHDLITGMSYNINWIHVFIKSDAAQTVQKAEALVNEFNSDTASNQLHILLDSDIKWKIIKKAILDYSKLALAGWRLRNVKQQFRMPGFDFNFWYVLQQDWKCSMFGSTAIENCFYLNLFENNLNQLPRQKKGFYLLENQAWERSLIYAWRKAGHGKIIGVQHTAVSYWDLRHFFSLKEYNSSDPLKLPMPDLVALNGNAASEMYIAGKFPREKIIYVEALRYLYLNNVNTLKTTLSNSNKTRLLVLGDYLSEVTDRQLQLLFNVSDKLSVFLEIIFKPHPANEINISKYKNHDLKMEITHNSLDSLVDKYDIAFSSCSTAAAVDTYLSGKRTLIMVSPGMFNMSPLRSFPGVEYIYTSNDLVSKLQCIKQVKFKKCNKCLDFFFLDTELNRWKNIIN